MFQQFSDNPNLWGGGNPATMPLIATDDDYSTPKMYTNTDIQWRIQDRQSNIITVSI